MATATRPPATTHRQGESVELDPLAGEDEPWAEEDFLYTPDNEDYFGFLRTLWLSVVVCGLFWLVLAIGTAQVVG